MRAHRACDTAQQHDRDIAFAAFELGDVAFIALYGQEGFRRLEQAALTQLLARKELMVLATGGGIVSEALTFDLILSSFYTIWLKAEPEEHMARVRRQGDLRPMADDRSAMAELRNILVSREPLYARASAVVDTAGLSVDAAAARLIDSVRPVLQNEARSFGLRSVALWADDVKSRLL
jgi:XRE family aerobic/anaerobic benzoate catabolism transcriptional regulator